MANAPRIPEGLKRECPICAKVDLLEPCYPGGSTVCPRCWQLFWLVQNQLSKDTGLPMYEIKLESRLGEDLGLESLEDLEALLAIEEHTGIRIHAKPEETTWSLSVRTIVEKLRRGQNQADNL